MNTNKKWRLNNPQAYKAHIILAWEIKCKRIIAQPCEVCGKTKVHGHHDDYFKPLDVRWLCSYHHRKYHHPQKAKKYIKKSIVYPKHNYLQQAVSLREGGKSYREIAIILNVTKGTIYKWINPNKGYK